MGVQGNGNVIILRKFLPLTALEFVKMTTSGAVSDEKFCQYDIALSLFTGISEHDWIVNILDGLFIGISEHDWIVNILDGQQSWREIFIMDLFMVSGLLRPEVFGSEHWVRVAARVGA